MDSFFLPYQATEPFLQPATRGHTHTKADACVVLAPLFVVMYFYPPSGQH